MRLTRPKEGNVAASPLREQRRFERIGAVPHGAGLVAAFAFMLLPGITSGCCCVLSPFPKTLLYLKSQYSERATQSRRFKLHRRSSQAAERAARATCRQRTPGLLEWARVADLAGKRSLLTFCAMTTYKNWRANQPPKRASSVACLAAR